MPRINGNFKNASEASKYLYCDGSTFNATVYPKLAALIGTILPDLRGRILQGNDIGGTIIEAKLPNIKGEFASFFDAMPFFPAAQTGVFYTIGYRQNLGLNPGGKNWAGNTLIGFNAAQYNPIYSDTCNTVQPPAVTVRYYIRAK